MRTADRNQSPEFILVAIAGSIALLRLAAPLGTDILPFSFEEHRLARFVDEPFISYFTKEMPYGHFNLVCFWLMGRLFDSDNLLDFRFLSEAFGLAGILAITQIRFFAQTAPDIAAKVTALLVYALNPFVMQYAHWAISSYIGAVVSSGFVIHGVHQAVRLNVTPRLFVCLMLLLAPLIHVGITIGFGMAFVSALILRALDAGNVTSLVRLQGWNRNAMLVLGLFPLATIGQLALMAGIRWYYPWYDAGFFNTSGFEQSLSGFFAFLSERIGRSTFSVITAVDFLPAGSERWWTLCAAILCLIAAGYAAVHWRSNEFAHIALTVLLSLLALVALSIFRLYPLLGARYAIFLFAPILLLCASGAGCLMLPLNRTFVGPYGDRIRRAVVAVGTVALLGVLIRSIEARSDGQLETRRAYAMLARGHEAVIFDGFLFGIVHRWTVRRDLREPPLGSIDAGPPPNAFWATENDRNLAATRVADLLAKRPTTILLITAGSPWSQHPRLDAILAQNSEYKAIEQTVVCGGPDPSDIYLTTFQLAETLSTAAELPRAEEKPSKCGNRGAGPHSRSCGPATVRSCLLRRRIRRVRFAPVSAQRRRNGRAKIRP